MNLASSFGLALLLFQHDRFALILQRVPPYGAVINQALYVPVVPHARHGRVGRPPRELSRVRRFSYRSSIQAATDNGQLSNEFRTRSIGAKLPFHWVAGGKNSSRD